MTCKLCGPEGGIPPFLCVACNPRTHTRPEHETEEAVRARLELSEDFTERHAKRKKRKLRAEVKQWRDRIALMQKYNRSTAKAEEALRQAEHALYLVA